MSYASGAAMGGSDQAPWGQSARRQGCGRLGWHGGEIAAMVLGFIVFWPIGLAIIAAKIWQKRSGHPGPLGAMLRERAQEAWTANRGQSWGGSRTWAPFAERSTGNTAFDDWRTAELSRLDEERRKLDAAEREFAEYAANLRRAKDREEFDRFMRDRKPASGETPAA